MKDRSDPDALVLEASAVQQGLFLPSSYERRPPPPPPPDKRQTDLFAVDGREE